MDSNKLSKLLTLNEACLVLNVHPNTLRKWDKEGKLKAIRFGTRGDIRYSEQDIFIFIQKNK